MLANGRSDKMFDRSSNEFISSCPPLNRNNKLLFCLCRSCVFKRNISGECKHLRDDERTLTGMWVLDEFRLEVEKVYRILDNYEVYEYQITQYSREAAEGGIFVDYINTSKTKRRSRRLYLLVSKLRIRRAIYSFL